MEKKNEIIEAEVMLLSDKAVQFALDNKSSIEQIEKLLILKREFDKDEAKKAYNVAMAEFKSHPPKIEKDKTVKFNTTKWSYAPLHNIVEAITPELSKNGLSISWRTKQNGKIVVACRVSHVRGHYEEIELSADADTSGSKNPIQAIGSTISYLQRYSLLSILGLATEDMDDDGVAAATAFIDDKQKSQLVDMLADKNISIEIFCSKFNLKNLDELPQSRFQQAISVITAAKKKEGKK